MAGHEGCDDSQVVNALLPLRLSENVHLPFDKLMALSKIEGPFDKPFDRLTVLSKVEGLTAISKAEGLRYPHPPPC